MSVRQSERAYKEMMDKFTRMAEEYNRRAAAESNARAIEEWNKYVPGHVGSAAMHDSIARYGASSRGGSMSAQVNIQTGPVTEIGGQQYVTRSDMEQATRSTASQVLNQLRSNPATRREVGLAR
jgi:hypothetical protein